MIQDLLQNIRATLSALPDVKLSSVEPMDRAGPDRGVDVEIRMDVQGRPLLLLGQVRQGGYPRDVREAAWRLASLRRTCDTVLTLPLVIAPMLSETSRAFLQEEGLAYCDAAGNVYLKLPWAFIFVDRPRQETEKRRTRNLFRGASGQVLHLLVSDAQHSWHIQEVARRAEVAPSTAHQVLSTLEKETIVESSGRGPNLVRRLRDPGSLLTSWAEAHSLKAYRPCSYYRWMQSPAQLRDLVAKELDIRNVSNALTLTSGAEFSAPHSTGVDRLNILVPQDAPLERIAEAAKLKPVTDGGNVTFLLTKEKAPLMLRRQIEGVWVASDIQLYLDLYALPTRGKEQAAHLRRERLQF